MAVVDILNTKAEKVSEADLPDEIFNVAVTPGVLHEVVIMQLAARRAVGEIENADTADLAAYADERTERYQAMVDRIRERLCLTTLRYQTMDDMVRAIGLPKERLCTYCWDGAGVA